MTPKPYFLQITACAKYFNAVKKYLYLSEATRIIALFEELYINKRVILTHLPAKYPAHHFISIEKIRAIVPGSFLFFQISFDD
jgi:hypothetical protein